MNQDPIPPVDESTITPRSDSQELLTKVDERDKLVRAIEIIILVIAVTFNVFLGLQFRTALEDSRAEAKSRSEAAQIDRDEQEEYFKCLSVLRFDVPAEILNTREGVIKALDSCAAANRKQ